jgi:hypothetical protein
MEQAKSVRRDSPGCTRHAQFFHKFEFCATLPAQPHLQGNLQIIYRRTPTFAQDQSKSS